MKLKAHELIQPLVIIAALSSFAGQVKADCSSDLTSINMDESIVAASNATDAECGEETYYGECFDSYLQPACEALGADYIKYNGTLTCGDLFPPRKIENLRVCLPQSCMVEAYFSDLEKTLAYYDDCKFDIDFEVVSDDDTDEDTSSSAPTDDGDSSSGDSDQGDSSSGETNEADSFDGMVDVGGTGYDPASTTSAGFSRNGMKGSHTLLSFLGAGIVLM